MKHFLAWYGFTTAMAVIAIWTYSGVLQRVLNGYRTNSSEVVNGLIIGAVIAVPLAVILARVTRSRCAGPDKAGGDDSRVGGR
jgi:uncharacterized membrane protein